MMMMLDLVGVVGMTMVMMLMVMVLHGVAIHIQLSFLQIGEGRGARIKSPIISEGSEGDTS